MNQGFGYHMPLTPAVKWLLALTVGSWFFFQVIGESFLKLPVTYYFGLYPGQVVGEFYFWQPVTYLFLHAAGVSHILFNMLALWMIGASLEERWGRKFFLFYYFATGAGAALFYCFGVAIFAAITGEKTLLEVPVVGASGAVFGLLLAFGLLFGERTISFMMLFPMKAKIFVLILAGVEFVSLLGAGGSGDKGVANLAHIGGFVSGYLVLFVYTKIQRSRWKKGFSKKKSRNLRLIVDNENEKPPKYWN